MRLTRARPRREAAPLQGRLTLPDLLKQWLVPGLASALLATSALAAGTPTVGSGDTAVADLPVPRPGGTPCVFALFTGLAFADFSSKSFDYAPTCAGPWA